MADLPPNARTKDFLALVGSLMGTAAGPAPDEAPAAPPAEEPGRGDGSAGLVTSDLLVAGMAAAASPPSAPLAAPGDAGLPSAGAAEAPLLAAAPGEDTAPDPDAAPLPEAGIPGDEVPDEAALLPGRYAGDRSSAVPSDMAAPRPAAGEGAAARRPEAQAGGADAAVAGQAGTRNAASTPPPADTVPAEPETAPPAPAVSGDDAGPDDARAVAGGRAASDAEIRPTAGETAVDRDTSRGSPDKTASADQQGGDGRDGDERGRDARGGDARGEHRSDDPDRGSGGRSDREARSVNVLRNETADVDPAPAGRERTATAEMPPAGDAGTGNDGTDEAAMPARAQPMPPAAAPAGTTEAAAAAWSSPDAGDGVVLTPVGGRVPGPDGASTGLPPQSPAPGGQGAAGQPHPASEMVGVSLSRMADGRADRMRIQLRPAELGSVEVTLEFRQDGTVQARILAERPDALDLLQRDSKALEKSLQDAGFQTGSDSLSFDLRGGQQGERNLAGFRQAFGKARSREAADETNADAIRQMTFVATPGQATAPGRVDIRI